MLADTVGDKVDVATPAPMPARPPALLSVLVMAAPAEMASTSTLPSTWVLPLSRAVMVGLLVAVPTWPLAETSPPPEASANASLLLSDCASMRTDAPPVMLAFDTASELPLAVAVARLTPMPRAPTEKAMASASA